MVVISRNYCLSDWSIRSYKSSWFFWCTLSIFVSHFFIQETRSFGAVIQNILFEWNENWRLKKLKKSEKKFVKFFLQFCRWYPKQAMEKVLARLHILQPSHLGKDSMKIRLKQNHEHGLTTFQEILRWYTHFFFLPKLYFHSDSLANSSPDSKNIKCVNQMKYFYIRSFKFLTSVCST